MNTGIHAWYPQFQQSTNHRVLLLLSGGVDSTLCAYILNDLNINFEAVHFFHDWSWPLCTEEARHTALDLEFSLHEIDLTGDFEREIINQVSRPCSTCKRIMDEHALLLCQERECAWICTGDIATDVTMLSRLDAFERSRGNSNLFITRYLDSGDSEIQIPAEIQVLRPILHLQPEEVIEELKREHRRIVRRVYEAGDPSVNHWREGCPLHYVDPGEIITRELMDQLWEDNILITEWGRKSGIRAARCLPSGRVLTRTLRECPDQ